MNEFVARNGLIALDSSSISGPLTVSGNVGIGTNAPTEELTILGTIRSNAKTGADNVFLEGYNSAGTIVAQMREASTGGFGGLAFNGQRVNNTGGGGVFFQAFVGTTASGNNSAIEFRGTGGTIASPADLPLGIPISIFSKTSGSAVVNQMALFQTGNLLIQNGGTFTDGGQRLQVIGDTLIRGSGNTSATTALTIQNSGSSALMVVRNDSNVGINTNSISYGSAANSAGRLTINNSSGNNGLVIRNADDGYALSIKTTTNDAIGVQFTWYNGATQTFLQHTGTVTRIGTNTAGYSSAVFDPSVIQFLFGTSEVARLTSGGNLGIGTTNPTYKLDVNGSFRATGSITATSGSDYFDISHDITQPAQTGSQVYEVNITPTLRYTAPNQTQTALRVAATFTGSTALSSSQSNIIADFGSTSAGSQLVINDTTSGSIYMVNDVSGLPIIEANSNWDVFIYDYPTKVFQKSGSNITISGSFNTSGSITIGSGSGDLYMYGHKMFSVGQFQNNSTLSGSANVSQSFVYDTTDFSEGVTLVSGSRLTVTNAGHYNIQFSAQLQNTVNTTANLWIWFKINGTNVPESATRVVLRKDEYHIAAWNFAYPANANDYFEIVWQSDSVDTRILYEPASGNIPIIPSIITTVTQIR